MLAPEEVEVVGYKSEQEVVVEEECKPELEEVKVVVEVVQHQEFQSGSSNILLIANIEQIVGQAGEAILADTPKPVETITESMQLYG